MSTRRGKKYRRVYPYNCIGCGKDRIAFKYERAVERMCTRCEALQPPKDQAPLFPHESHTS